MKTIFQHIVPVLLALVICSSGICWAIVIKVTGNWSVDIDASNLQAGAGSNLISTYESSADLVTIDISDTVGDWAVNVRMDEGGDWHPNLHLYVKRTSDGTGGSISGGSVYQLLTDTDQPFFNGNGDRSGVNVQLQLTGVSIQVPPDVYITTVYYTVSDQG